MYYTGRNEVRRCGYLYPCFFLVYAKARKPLSLIEIGTSAGLQLLWDKYAYSYNISDKTYGDVDSPVRIASEIRGDRTPPFLGVIPPVASRIGIDLHLNDLRDPEDRLWLKALIWPEHDDRRELFERAADCFKNHPVELVEADGVTHLPLVAERIPQDTAICIFHTHVANQMPSQTNRVAAVTRETRHSNPDRKFSCCQHPRFFGKFKNNAHIQMR